ncbi:MAG: flagellar protein FlbB [Pseudolabrys sp.]
MNRLARDFRLIPVVLFATISLLTLKVSGLVFDGGYTLAERMQARYSDTMRITTRDSVPEYPKIIIADKQGKFDTPGRQQPWAQEMFNFSDNRSVGAKNNDITGSTGAEEKPSDPALKVSDKPPDPPKLEVAGAAIPLEPGRIASPGERAVLERLQSRRQELETRNRELEMRESLLKAAEKRLDEKFTELKDTEGRINTAMGTRDQMEAQRFKGIVSMYENMKAKEAARIFERLDLKILVDVSTQINPRKMSEILAQMSPDSAERLTVELANRATPQPKTQNPDQLPKIEGKQTAN